MMTNSKKYGTKIQTYTLQNGDVAYYIFYKDGNKSVRKKIGRKSEGITEKTAIDKYNSVIVELRHGVDLSIKKSEKFMAFDSIAKKYFEDKEIHNKSNHKSKLIYEKHIKPYIGPHKIASINDDVVIDIQKILKKQGYSDSTNNRIVSQIKTILNYSVKIGLIKNNRLRNIQLINSDNKRERILSSVEVQELYKILEFEKITTKIFAYLSLTTGARAESILSIQVKHINLENKTVLLHDHKRNISYSGILTVDVLNLLKEYFKVARPNIYLTSMKKQKLTYSAMHARFTRIFKPLNEGIKKHDRKNRIVIHSLRHTFASHLTMAGTSARIVQNLMNHADEKMTGRYTHLYENIGADKINSLYKKG